MLEFQLFPAEFWPDYEDYACLLPHLLPLLILTRNLNVLVTFFLLKYVGDYLFFIG